MQLFGIYNGKTNFEGSRSIRTGKKIVACKILKSQQEKKKKKKEQQKENNNKKKTTTTTTKQQQQQQQQQQKKKKKKKKKHTEVSLDKCDDDVKFVCNEDKTPLMTGLLHFKAIKFIYPAILWFRRTFEKIIISNSSILLFCGLEEHSRKLSKFEKIKNNNSSHNESIRICLCFSHYKHHKDIKQPECLQKSDLFRFWVKFGAFNILMNSASKE